MSQEKKWIIKQTDYAIVTRLAEELKIHASLCKLLIERGIHHFDEAKHFFRPLLSDLHDPYLMKDMDKATERIQQAVDRNENIMVYGDYDVDGTTSVALIYHYLKTNIPPSYSGSLSYYIPHRYHEGYGISTKGIDTAESQRVQLIICLDCGIKSVDKVAYAKQKGIDFIICDHHLPGDMLPEAYAILNPKQTADHYPYKELSGCGIGFKLASALSRHWHLPEEAHFHYLDIVATSIAADIVPINGENRILAFYGIRKLNDNPCLALQTLKKLIGITKPMHVSDIVFTIAPRINAAGRMDDATKIVDLFIEDDPEKSMEKALYLQEDNQERKIKDKDTTESALEMLQEDKTFTRKHATVVFHASWHKGVVGIVASRLIDHYYRPTIVLTESEGKITGSARSVKGFNIHHALVQCQSLLENFGGHSFAAGMTLLPKNLEAFKSRFEEVVCQSIQPESLYPQLEIDAEIPLFKIKESYYKILEQFEPFGPTNLRPVFLSRNVTDFRHQSHLIKDMHIKFWLQQGSSHPVTGIGFCMQEKFSLLKKGPVDIVYTIEENEWHNQKSIQIKIIDFRPSKQQTQI